jgi:hypothetical protein
MTGSRWAASGNQDTGGRCASYPTQQSTAGDNLGRRIQEKVTSWVCPTTEEGHRGGNLVECFELHEIDPRRTFRPPQSSTRTGTYSAYVLGIGLPYPSHDELMMRAR